MIQNGELRSTNTDFLSFIHDSYADKGSMDLAQTAIARYAGAVGNSYPCIDTRRSNR